MFAGFDVCEACGLHRFCKNPLIKGRGNRSPKVILIGESPGFDDDTDGVSFSGKVGAILSSTLGEYEKDCYITHAVKCLSVADPVTRTGIRAPSELEIDYCKKILNKELMMFEEGTTIVTMGNVALTSILGPHRGIMKELGVARKVNIFGKMFKLIPNYHPAAMLRNPQWQPDFQRIMHSAFTGKFKEESGALIKTLNYEESMEQIQRAMDLYRKGDIGWSLFDIETNAFTAWKGKTIMYSIAHNADDTAYSIPVYINNDFKINKEDAVDLFRKNEYSRWTYENEDIKDTPDFGMLRDGFIDRLYKEIVDQYRLDFNISPQQSVKLNAAIKEFLQTVPIAGHNLKFDLKFKYIEDNLDLSRVRVAYDTLIMAHQLYGRTPGASLKLKDLCRKLFNVQEDWEVSIHAYQAKFKRVDDRHYGNIPTKILGDYSALDSYYNKMLVNHLDSSMHNDMKFICNAVTSATIPYVEAESKGIKIDTDMLSYLANAYKDHLDNLLGRMKSLPAVSKFIDDIVKPQMIEQSKKTRGKFYTEDQFKEDAFLPSSVKKVSTIMYGSAYLGLPKLRGFTTDKGDPSTNSATLEEMIKHPDITREARDFLGLMMSFRTFNTLLSRYISPVPESMIDGLYKHEFNLTGTVTGRMSSGFHTLPRESDIKRLYTSRWLDEGGLFLAADMSQLEIRIGASLSKEWNLIDAYKEGIDIHTRTASIVFDKSMDQVKSDERTIGKTVNFAIFYGKGAETLAQDMKMSVEKARWILDSFFKGNHALSDWIDKQHQFVRNHGYITTPYGRLIAIPEGLSEEPRLIGDALRRSVNFPVQSTASDTVLIASNEIYYGMKKDNLNSIFLGSVHDSEEFDIYPGELPSIIRRVKEENEVKIVERFPWILCPLEMDVSLGASWGGAIEFNVRECSDKHLVLTNGKSLRKDFRMLEYIGSKCYNIKVEVTNVKELTDKDFADDSFVRDTEEWTADVTIELNT